MAGLYSAVSPSGALEWTGEDARLALDNGSIAMCLCQLGGMAADESFFLFPSFDGGTRVYSGSGSCFALTAADEKRLPYAQDVLALLYESEYAVERAEAEKALPALLSALEGAQGGQTDSLARIVAAGNWYAPGQENWLSPVAVSLMDNLTVSQALQGACDGSLSPEEAFEMIDKAVVSAHDIG